MFVACQYMLAREPKSLRSPLRTADRFHAGNHKEPDCLRHCNPEGRSEGLLWTTDLTGDPKFRFNSAIQESANIVFCKLGPFVKKMNSVMNRFIFNELWLREKGLDLNARFRPWTFAPRVW